MDPFLGQIQSFGFNFAPRGWALCNGQLISIQQNNALFALLGVTYGGDGVRTFGLPDLRSRVPISQGQLPGGGYYTIGEAAGVEQVTVLTPQLPTHNHTMNASSGTKLNADPKTNNFGGFTMYTNAALGAMMDPATIGASGNTQPHENRQPYLIINWCISTAGTWPARN